MSEFFTSAECEGAQAVGIGALSSAPLATGFRARFADGQEISTYHPRGDGMAPDVPLGPLEQARADAFAEGFDAGARITRESMVEDITARQALAHAIEQLAPSANGALSSLLSAAVLRLVGQIVGEVPLDADLLRSRCEAVAAFAEQEQARGGLHIHPNDIALLDGAELGVALLPDDSMARGSIRLDTSEGWIEDGPDIQLARLKALLDDMEGRA